MAAIDQDYVLGIAVQLQTDSVAALEAQLQAVADKIKPITVKAVANATAGGMTVATEAAQKYTVAINEATQATDKFNTVLAESRTSGAIPQQERINTLQREQTSIIDANTQAYQEQVQAVRTLGEQMKANTMPLVNGQTLPAALQQQSDMMALRQKIGANTIMAPNDTLFEKQSAVLDKYVPKLNAAVAAQSEMKSSWMGMLQTGPQVSHLLASMGNIATWMIGMTALFAAGSAAFKGFQDAIHSQQEQVIQGFYYGAAGTKFTPAMSQQTMTDAIVLARKYGDEVIKTQEAIGLWAKATHGELVPSLAMADQALKLNAVTGMNNEEIYRSTVAVLAQYSLPLSRVNDLYDVGIGLAFRYAGGIKMVGGEAQDAARQMIEGMDTSAAVASSFGLTMEQSAAAVVTLLQAGNFTSGKSAGQKFSMAFDTFRKGASEKALAEMGISTVHNKNFMQELYAKQNEIVPGTGTTLGKILEAHVSPRAIEALMTLLKNVNLYKQAYKEAYNFEHSHPLQAAYIQLRATDAYKINQLKASFEAISIVIARQFIPALGTAMDDFQRMVPGIIAAGPAIGEIAMDLLKLGVVFGALEGIKLFASMLLTVGTQARTFASAMGALSAAVLSNSEVTIASAAASNVALSSEQKTAISMLTNNAVVTDGMAEQWLNLATQQGVSVDVIIGALRKLQLEALTTARITSASEDSMATNLGAVAAQMGLEADQVKASFAGIDTAATVTAGAVKAAFMSVIPVIGWVAVAAIAAVQAFHWAISSMEKGKISNEVVLAQSGDWKPLNQDVRSTNAKIAEHEALIRRDKYSLGHTLSMGPGWLSSTITRVGTPMLVKDVLHNQDAIAREQAYLANLKNQVHPPLSVEQQIAMARKGALHSMYATPPGQDGTGQTVVAPSTKGLSTDYGRQGNAIQSVASSYKALLAQKSAVIDADKSEAARLTGLISLYGNNEQITQKLIASYKQEASAIAAKLTVEEGYYNALEATIRKDATAKTKYGANTKEYAGFTHDINMAKNAASAMVPQMQALKDLLQQLSVISEPKALKALVDYQQKIASSDALAAWHKAEDAFKAHLITLTDLSNAANAYASAMDKVANAYLKVHMVAPANAAQSSGSAATSGAKAKFSELADYISSSTQSLTDKIIGNNLGMSGILPADATFARAIRSAKEQFDSFMKQWNKWVKDDGASAGLNNVKSLAQAWLKSADALAEYNKRLAEVKASPGYAAVTTLGNDVGSSLTSSVMSSFTNSDQNQIYALESQIAALENEKNLLTGKNNLAARMMLENRIRQLEADKNGIDQRMRHPAFLKGIEEDMAKAVMKGLTTELTKDLQKAFINAILPKNPAENPQIVATTTNTTALHAATTALQQLTQHLGGTGGPASFGGGGGSILSSSGSSWGSAFSSMIPSGIASALSASGGYSAPSSSSSPASSSGGLYSASASSALGGVGLGGVGSAIGAGAGIAAGAGVLGAASSLYPFFGNALGTPNGPATSGSGSGGSGSAGAGGYWSSGKGNAQHIMAGLGGIAGIMQGYDQGGASGAIEAGMGMQALLHAIAPSFGPWGIALDAAAALLTLFHPHYNPSTNPDMYASSGFAQGVADAQGQAYTQATGWVYEDAALKQQLGNMTELQYLDAWYNAYPGGNGLNEQGQQLWDEIGKLTGSGKGVGVEGLHQGNVFVSDGKGHKVGESGNWQTVLQDIDTYTQDLYALENQDMTGKGTWVSVNSYGAGGGGSTSFSPWYSPGLSSSDVGAVTAMPYPPLNSNAFGGTSVSPSPGTPSGGSGYGGGGSGGGGPQGVTPMNVSTAVYLNSDVIAQQVNAFNLQRQGSGWAMNY